MRLPEISLVAVALAAFGCSQPPKAVFVDLERISLAEQPSATMPIQSATPSQTTIPSRQLSLAPAKSVFIPDKAEAKIELARKLIEADRESAIRTLGRRLAAVRSEEIDLQKRAALEELDARLLVRLRAVYDQLFEVFRIYALQKGPKVARVEVLKSRRPDLYISRATPTKFAEKQRQELASIRALITELESEHERNATRILDEVQIQNSTDQGALQARFETMRANAIEQAQQDARRAIEKAGQGLDLDLGQSQSVRVSAVKGESVQIAGSVPMSIPVPELNATPVIGSTERRTNLEQQLEIWLKVRGMSRASTRSGGRDATEEFMAWRKNHRVGP